MSLSAVSSVPLPLCSQSGRVKYLILFYPPGCHQFQAVLLSFTALPHQPWYQDCTKPSHCVCLSAQSFTSARWLHASFGDAPLSQQAHFFQLIMRLKQRCWISFPLAVLLGCFRVSSPSPSFIFLLTLRCWLTTQAQEGPEALHCTLLACSWKCVHPQHMWEQLLMYSCRLGGEVMPAVQFVIFCLSLTRWSP